MASDRVELARPFAVVHHGQIWHFVSEAEAIERRDWILVNQDSKSAPIVVRLTAERVEEPIPEAKSGWGWRVRDKMIYRFVDDVCLQAASTMGPWRSYVPPCDHAHVEALLQREGVEA